MVLTDGPAGYLLVDRLSVVFPECPLFHGLELLDSTGGPRRKSIGFFPTAVERPECGSASNQVAARRMSRCATSKAVGSKVRLVMVTGSISRPRDALKGPRHPDIALESSPVREKLLISGRDMRVGPEAG